MYKRYSEEEFPRYVNYPAINVDRTSDIPMDYDGEMGVPITFMDKYCPEQFEIVGLSLLLSDIRWIVRSDKSEIVEKYMGLHQGEEEATELWLHFQKVVNWVTTLFPAYRREMKGLDWGRLYTKYGARKYNPTVLEKSVAELMADRDVQSKKGIYEFLLSDRTLPEKLNLRVFDPEDMRTAYENQQGVCPVCKRHYAFEEMRGDHIRPWSKGGKTRPENLQMLCADCNARKSDKF